MGLSEKDITMASLCDALARDFGEQREHLPECAATANASSLVDQVIASTGECGPCSK
jgi:hypothetical protein